jgi:hypothetical protein
VRRDTRPPQNLNLLRVAIGWIGGHGRIGRIDLRRAVPKRLLQPFAPDLLPAAVLLRILRAVSLLPLTRHVSAE